MEGLANWGGKKIRKMWRRVVLPTLRHIFRNRTLSTSLRIRGDNQQRDVIKRRHAGGEAGQVLGEVRQLGGSLASGGASQGGCEPLDAIVFALRVQGIGQAVG